MKGTNYKYRLTFNTQLFGTALSDNDYGNNINVGKNITVILYLKKQNFCLFNTKKTNNINKKNIFKKNTTSTNFLSILRLKSFAK